MLYEVDDKRWPKFTFRFCESDDLVNWRLIGDAIYGEEKRIGGPALYYQDGWFYCMYTVGDIEKGWDTQVARSKDLKTWHDAPSDRKVIVHDPEDWIDPSRFPDSKETSASDAELCEFRGKTILYWNGSEQEFCGNLKYGIYEGPASEYLASFFE